MLYNKTNVLLFTTLVLALGMGAFARFPLQKKKKIQRVAQCQEVDPLFIERWSPRAMSGEMVEESDIKALFEAARWAPSSYNEQPWRFIYAVKNTPEWQTFFDLLVPFNQAWCKDGAVLVVLCSKISSDHGGDNSTHSFDTGAAWQNLALQGHLKGLVVHGMGGFDHAKARVQLNIPHDYAVEAMCVIGKPGDPKNLPDYLQENEKPSGRKDINQIVCQGSFNF